MGLTAGILWTFVTSVNSIATQNVGRYSCQSYFVPENSRNNHLVIGNRLVGSKSALGPVTGDSSNLNNCVLLC